MGSLQKRLRGGRSAVAAPEGHHPPDHGRNAQKTFLLGLGAQKGGTTWLHSYLASSPQYAGGYRKEYHVFDASDLESERWMRDRILRMAADELEKARRGEPCDAKQLHRASMYADHELYYDFFAGLLHQRRRYRLTADLTPAYAMLPAERVARIQESFAARRIRTVAIFLMRDPVERIWSQARMQDQRQPQKFGSTAESIVAAQYAATSYAIRTRYEHTLDVIDEVFGPADAWCGFYEELFEEAQVRQICELTGIDYREPDFEQRRNAYPKGGATLPDDLVEEVAIHYRDTYEAVARRFPHTSLPEIWPSSRFVL